MPNFNLGLSYVAMVKSTVEILQNFVAFSQYMSFNVCENHLHLMNPTAISIFRKFPIFAAHVMNLEKASCLHSQLF